jgi:hypothetical protein
MTRGQNKKANVSGVDKLLINNNFYLLIAVFLIIVIIKIILSLKLYSPFVLNDELNYDSLAKNVLNGKLVPIIGDTRSPGYPIVLSVAYLLSGDKGTIYHIMLLISALISTSMIFPSYFILKKYCTEMLSLLGAIAVTTLPFMNLYGFTIMSEALFIPLFMFSIWFLINSYETDDKKWQLLASASAVYLYMTRPNGLAIAIAFIAAFIFYVYDNLKYNNIYNIVLNKIYLIASFIILLISWILYSAFFSNSITSAGSIIFILMVIAIVALLHFISTQRNIKFGFNLSRGNYLVISVSLLIVILIFIYLYIKDIVSLFLNSNSYYSFGSSFNLIDTSKHLLDIFNNWGNFAIFIGVIANDLSYLFICSYFILSFLLVYYISLLYNKKADKNIALSTVAVYVLVSALFLLLSVIALRFSGGWGFDILGRYIDPILPVIILFSIIILNKLNSIKFSKYTGYFAVIYLGTVLLTLFVLEYNNAIISGLEQLQDNVALYYLDWFYQSFFPEVFVLMFSLIIMALLYLSIKNKRYTAILLIFIIISSIIFSISVYNAALDSSNFRKDNPINQYLVGHTDRNTLLVLDSNIDPEGQMAELGIYGFWNNGNTIYFDANHANTSRLYNANDTYLISTATLPYTSVATDDKFKLYVDN